MNQIFTWFEHFWRTLKFYIYNCHTALLRGNALQPMLVSKMVDQLAASRQSGLDVSEKNCDLFDLFW